MGENDDIEGLLSTVTAVLLFLLLVMLFLLLLPVVGVMKGKR